MIRLISVAICVLMLCQAASAAPIWEFKFDSTGPGGVGALNTGTDLTNLVTDNAIYSAPANVNLLGAPGSGVTGGASDLSLDLRAAAPATGRFPGQTSSFGNTVANANCTAIQNLQSFTMTLWFNPGSNSLGSYAANTNGYMIGYGGWNTGVKLYSTNGSPYSTGNQLRVGVDDATAVADIGSVLTYSDTNKWLFIAVTYDGTQTANNLKVYVGSDTLAASLVDTASVNVGAVDTFTNAFTLAGDPNNSSGYLAGAFDNFRILGSKTDATGVLDGTAIEALRAGDAIPEPATLALLVMGGVGMLVRRKR